MADASYTQTSFLGGEISQFAQGQYDKPWYKTALNKLFNIWPSDEGAAHRRPGTRVQGFTNRGKPGRLFNFTFTAFAPYTIEVTDSVLRMWGTKKLATYNQDQFVQNISGDAIAVFTLFGTVPWQTGDTVYFSFTSPGVTYAAKALLNRQFIITMINDHQFTVADAITGHQIGSGDNVVGLVVVVSRVLTIAAPYTVAQKDWHNLRLIQGYNVAVLLHSQVAPQALQVLSQPTPPPQAADATFSFSAAQFQDGPYLDPFPNAVAYINGTSSIIQVTAGFPQWIGTNTIYGFGATVSYMGSDFSSLINNNLGNTPPNSWQALTPGTMVNSGLGFQATDIGRMIRLFYNPQIWAPGTTYAAGANVTYNGAYFTSLVNSNTGNAPDISTTDWTINTAVAYWTWGFITAVNSANNVTVQLKGPVLLDTTPVLLWRLGAWSDTTGWPTCGCYQEGRLWYSGAIPNRVDSSSPNTPFLMSPTGQDGTVADSNGISYTLNADEQNLIVNMLPDHQGILLFTEECEFLLTSGTSGAPMTPSNIQAHRETKYGSSNVLAVRTGLTICFVKRYARRLMEYLADVFSGRFYGNDLTQNARHLGARNIEEIAFQEELIPTVWGRCGDGTFIGTTYRRNTLFSTQPPEFNGWHQHALGSERQVESICTGPSVGGTLDTLAMVTNDPGTGIRLNEQMTTLLDETDPLTDAWFLDTAITPPTAAADIKCFFDSSTWGSGNLDALMDLRPQSAEGISMRPIVAAGAASNPTAVWLGGYQNPGSSCIFQISKIAVSGDNPTISSTYTSSTFAASDPQDHSWALDPTGQYIAMYLQNASSITHEFVIFDTVNLVFGAVLSVDMGNSSATKQIAWLDATHLMIDHVVSTVRGIEVLSVSGTTITDVGFTGVWGSGSNTSRLPLSYAQYIPNPQAVGFINIMSDSSGSSFSAIYGVTLAWVSGAVVVGTPYTIASGLLPGTGSGPHTNLILTNATTSEWTLVYGTVVNYALMSFIAGSFSATITRQWQSFVPAFGEGTTTSPIYYSETNTFILVQRCDFDNNYRTSTLYLDPNSFVLMKDGEIVANVTALVSSFMASRLDSKRFIFVGTGGFGFDEGQVGIVKDTTGTPSTVTFYGLDYYNGKKVSVFAAAVDCGDYIVTGGILTVPLGTIDALTGAAFSEESFKILQPKAATFENLSCPVLFPGTTYEIPCVIGFNYESQGQLCRPQTPQDTGARNGPGFGKKRRSARYAIQLVNSLGVRVGTKLNKTKPVPLTKIDAGGQRLNYLDTFSGIIRETLEDDFSYDSMLAWKTARPYPTTVTILGGFIETSDG